MYILIENDEMKGFVKEKEKGKQYIEINEKEFNELMSEQSQGLSLFYDKKTKKIDSIKLNQYEKFENGEIVFQKEEKIESLKNKLYNLRLEYDVKPFEFEVDGVTYLQKNRSIDPSNLTRIVVMCQATKKTTFDNWKFYTKDNSEKYVNISLQDMMKMAIIMQEQTTKSMATETLRSHNLENLTVEELKNYNVKERYEKVYGEMR